VRHRTDKVGTCTYDPTIVLPADSPKLESAQFVDSFETVLYCLKRMEATLMGMKELRVYAGKGVVRKMLDELIEEAETQIAEIKRKVIQ
jgi:hypothetical protein